MRDTLIKLYVDDREAEMIQEMAREWDLPINRYLRKILSIEAIKYGFDDAALFLRKTHRSKQGEN